MLAEAKAGAGLRKAVRCCCSLTAIGSALTGVAAASGSLSALAVFAHMIFYMAAAAACGALHAKTVTDPMREKGIVAAAYLVGAGPETLTAILALIGAGLCGYALELASGQAWSALPVFGVLASMFIVSKFPAIATVQTLRLVIKAEKGDSN